MSSVQARVSPEGFVAQRLAAAESSYRWVLTYMEDHQINLKLLTDDEVEDWAELRHMRETETPSSQSEQAVTTPSAAPSARRSVDLQADGLLWLINRVVFHPRGYALGVDPTNQDWWLLGDGTEPWVFYRDGSDEAGHLARVRDLMS